MFIHNIKIVDEKILYESNFKCERDDYERIQLLEEKLENHEIKEENHDLMKLKYIQFVQRIAR